MKTRLLVTGFGPFPGIAVNPSGEIARRVTASPRWRLLGVEAQALVLRTAYASIEGALAPALRNGGFDAVLMIGVAGRTKRIRVERRAANRASLLSPDASGKRRASLALEPGPAYRVAAASPARLIRLLRKHRLPCALSQDAGRYLCNACYSSALAEPVPVLFLHIPKPPRRKPRRKARHRTPRTNWHDRLAAGFVDVAIDLLTMSRREPRSRTPPCGSSGVACSLADVTAPGRA